MATRGWPPHGAHRHALHRLAQRRGHFAPLYPGADGARRLAQLFNESGERSPVGFAPQCVTAQGLASGGKAVDPIGQKALALSFQQGSEHGFNFCPPFRPGLAAQAVQPGIGARSAQREIKPAHFVQPCRPPLARADQRMAQ